MSRKALALAAAVCLIMGFAPPSTPTVSGQGALEAKKPEKQADAPRFDVCDVSYLWPVPKTAADVETLASADRARADTKSALWPEAAFNRMLEIMGSDAASVTPPGGIPRKIEVRPEFRDRKTWRVAGFRVDGGAPGGHSAIVAKFGEAPQLRLIFQPVTVRDGKAEVHDVAAHLVYNFVQKPKEAEKGFLPVNVPDTEKFRPILEDLLRLKASLTAR